MGFEPIKIRIGMQVETIKKWCSLYGINSNRVYSRIKNSAEYPHVALWEVLKKEGVIYPLSYMETVAWNVAEEIAYKKAEIAKRKQKHLYTWYVPLTSHSGVWRQGMLNAAELEAVKEYARHVREGNDNPLQ